MRALFARNTLRTNERYSRSPTACCFRPEERVGGCVDVEIANSTDPWRRVGGAVEQGATICAIESGISLWPDQRGACSPCSGSLRSEQRRSRRIDVEVAIHAYTSSWVRSTIQYCATIRSCRPRRVALLREERIRHAQQLAGADRCSVHAGSHEIRSRAPVDRCEAAAHRGAAADGHVRQTEAVGGNSMVLVVHHWSACAALKYRKTKRRVRVRLNGASCIAQDGLIAYALRHLRCSAE